MESVAIPNSVTCIGNSAFRDCEEMNGYYTRDEDRVAGFKKAIFKESCTNIINVNFINQLTN